jgi:hypothetical protein
MDYRRRQPTHCKLVSYLSVGFEFPVVRATSVTSDQSSMFIFNWVLSCNIWINNGPEMGIKCEGGGY